MAAWPYNTTAWKRLRRAKLARDPLCEYCPPDRPKCATQVDHLVAINAGGDPWAWSNLRSACASCHSRKTRYTEQLDREVPIKGADPETGIPLSPEHWWNRCEKISQG